MPQRIDHARLMLHKATSETILEPAEVAALLVDNARTNAPKRRLDFDLDFQHVLRQVDEGYCPKTGRAFDMRKGAWLPNRCSLDRIINHIGYYNDNVQIVVNQYNKAKQTYSEDETLQLALDIVKAAGYQVISGR